MKRVTRGKQICCMPSTPFRSSFSLVCTVVVACICSSDAVAGMVFNDGFAHFDTTRWNTNATVLRRLGAATCIGAPQTLQTQVVDGRSALRMRSTMNNAEHRGIATFDTFNLSGGRVEVDFKIMPRVAGSPPNNIDAILELSLLNDRTGHNFNIRVFGKRNLATRQTFKAPAVWIPFHTRHQPASGATTGSTALSSKTSVAGLKLLFATHSTRSSSHTTSTLTSRTWATCMSASRNRWASPDSRGLLTSP